MEIRFSGDEKKMETTLRISLFQKKTFLQEISHPKGPWFESRIKKYCFQIFRFQISNVFLQITKRRIYKFFGFLEPF
jgi:hypothetical protein